MKADLPSPTSPGPTLPTAGTIAHRTTFSRRLHEAAALIPNGPPLGQWAFKLLTAAAVEATGP